MEMIPPQIGCIKFLFLHPFLTIWGEGKSQLLNLISPSQQKNKNKNKNYGKLPQT
jgi:hypothetical protein